MSQQPKSATRRLAPAGALFALLGVALFAYIVYQSGVEEIKEKLLNLGAGFVIIIALAGLRFVLRALCWTLCFEEPHRLRLRDALRAYLTGDALGNVVPLGIVVSEPAKAALVRDRVPLVAAISAIAVENIFYSLSVALFVFSGAAALLASFPLSKALRWSSVGILAGVVVFVAVAAFVLHAEWKILSGVLERLYARGIARRVLEKRRAGARSLEERVYGFYRRNRARFLPILLLEFSFHLAGVAEVFVTLLFINGVAPPLLSAFVLESVNRVINVVFKFVPLRVGVDEAGTGLMTNLLRLGGGVGVTLAIVRKARMLVWTGVGIILLVSRGLSVRAAATDAQQALNDLKKDEGGRMKDEGVAMKAPL